MTCPNHLLDFDMESSDEPKVINLHWHKDVDTLPPNTVSICRPGPYGNPFSSKSGKYTREECVALHRIQTRNRLRSDGAYRTKMTKDLSGHDLACYCKNIHQFVSCHGDNYLRELKYLREGQELIDIEDELRADVKRLRHLIWSKVTEFRHDIGMEELMFELEEALRSKPGNEHRAWRAILLANVAQQFICLSEMKGEWAPQWVDYYYDMVESYIWGLVDKPSKPNIPKRKSTAHDEPPTIDK